MVYRSLLVKLGLHYALVFGSSRLGLGLSLRLGLGSIRIGI